MRSSLVFAAAVLVSCAAIVSGHMCLLGPPQRNGPLTITGTADPRCALLTAPCGGYGPEFPAMTAIHAGNNLTINFQKNVNHWKAGAGAEFRVAFSPTSEPKLNFTTVAVIPDMNEDALSIYALQITTPPTFDQRAVLQVIYDTKQGDVFYQCADIMVVECEDGDKHPACGRR